jgi:hypothetical protein
LKEKGKSKSRLELFVAPAILFSCRFMNFIAKNASATAKSSSAPAIGRERSARTAVQKNCPRNFPCLPPPTPVPVLLRLVVAVEMVAAVAVVATAMVTDALKR